MQTGTPAADVIDLADILRSLRNGWRIIAVSVVVGAVLAGAVVLLARPKFTGSASIVLKTGRASGAASGLAAAIGALSEGGGSGGGGGMLEALKPGVETEVEILQSRTLTGEVVDSLGLQAQVRTPRGRAPTHLFARLDLPGSFKPRTYVFEPVPGTSPGRYRFDSDDDSGVAVIGQPTRLAIGSVMLAAAAPRSPIKVIFRDREDAITRSLERLDFANTKTDIAHFTYVAEDSLTAAAVPNLLVDLYMIRRKGVDRGINQRTAEFLARKVDSVGTALAEAERALRREREANGVVSPILVGQTEYENENRLRQQLTEVQTQERMLQQLVDQIKAGTATPRQLASYPQYLGSGPINGLVGNLISIETERSALLGVVTEEDERVKALATRSRGLEAQLLPLAQTTLTALASQRTSIDQRLRSIEQSLVGAPRAAEQYTRLERDVLDLGKIYAGLQVRLVDQRLAAITEGGDVRALDVAFAPKKPSFPKPSLMMSSGIGGGLFVGIIVAVLMGIVGGRMYDAADVERRTGLPAMRFETTAPLLVGGKVSRTVIVAPINGRANAGPVAERLVQTATSRSLSATLLDLSAVDGTAGETIATAAALVRQDALPRFDVNGTIRRLEETHDLVVVRLPALTSHQAGAALDESRPVLLVAPEQRIERTSLQYAVEVLRRVGAPCAGVVLHGDDRRSLRA